MKKALANIHNFLQVELQTTRSYNLLKFFSFLNSFLDYENRKYHIEVPLQIRSFTKLFQHVPE